MADHERDPVIDAVARRLTTVTDEPAFRARVVSRLPPRVDVARWPGWVAPAVVTICVLTGIGGVVRLMREPRLVPAEQVVVAPSTVNPMHVPAPAPAPVDRAAGAGTVVAARAAARPSMALSSAPALPLLETEPLVPMANIQPEPMATPLLDVTPIATAPLVLAPLDGGKD